MKTKFSNFSKMDQGEINKGDYVIFNDTIYNNIFKDKIGQVLRVIRYFGEIDVEFEEPIGKVLGLSLNYIKHWSSNKEQLEMLINTKKYNI